jgi:hypothetical protein
MHSAPPSWPSGWRLALQSKHPIPRRTRATGSRCTPLRAALGRECDGGGCQQGDDGAEQNGPVHCSEVPELNSDTWRSMGRAWAQ